MQLPYPWFGGKSRIAQYAWKRIGTVQNSIEPFFGGGAWTIVCPLDPLPTRTINDMDGMVSNFWRAVQDDPDDVARWCDWPVDEARMHAAHLWLISRAEFRERIIADIDYYDAKIAGLWCWGLCQWIGGEWCNSKLYCTEQDLQDYIQQLPHLSDDGMGVHRPSQQIPHLSDDGIGVHRPSQQLPHLGDDGKGVHRPSQQLPHLGDDGKGVPDIFGARRDLYPYFEQLCQIMRGVRICCGDWSRVCGPSVTVARGITAVFLDPPYGGDVGRDNAIYAHEDLNVAQDVREWAIEWGDDPRMRIALCGYTGEHDDEMNAAGWEPYYWTTNGGYSNQWHGETNGNSNRHREVVWFSPHCLPDDAPTQLALFEEREESNANKG